ncbi:MAG: hypothetical protein QW594_00440 [Candidatus Woesearchaeota archaeon]
MQQTIRENKKQHKKLEKNRQYVVLPLFAVFLVLSTLALSACSSKSQTMPSNDKTSPLTDNELTGGQEKGTGSFENEDGLEENLLGTDEEIEIGEMI